jgi:hypothetical protein
MAVTGHPPHRPVLAALPHTVLTSDVPPEGDWRGTHAHHLTLGTPVPHSVLAVCWAPCCSPQSPAFPPPPPPPVFPPALFHGLADTALMFDSSRACMLGLCFSLPGPNRRLVSSGCRRGLSVLARAVSRCAGPVRNSRLRPCQCCLPVRSTPSAPEMRFSKLNSRPVDASVYASPGTLRHPAQDSRSRWFAIPFLQGSFIPDCTPVYPADCTPLRSRLGTRSWAFKLPTSRRDMSACLRPRLGK